MKNSRITTILLYLSAAVFLLGVGFKLGELKGSQNKTSRAFPVLNPFTSESAAALKDDIDLSQFYEVWDLIEHKYVEKDAIDRQKMVYGAIKGMSAALEDPYTFFLTPEENKRSKEDLNGSFEGIGAQLGLNDESNVIIIAPLKNSPAEQAGAEAGDIIVMVNDTDIIGWNLMDVVNIIRGPKGSTVTLGIVRDRKPLSLDIVRDEIIVDSIELTYDQSVAILKLNQFGDNTDGEWDRAAEEIAQKYKNGTIQGMVLDVRDNPGGYLEGAVYIASEFLPQGTLVVTQESTVPSEYRTYTVNRKGLLLDIPLVVLINEGSASASEIVSGALRDYDRAVLIGTKSFGKGSVQEAIDFSDNAGLHVTVAKWVLPKGDWINKKGIEPDIKVDTEENQDEELSDNTPSDIQLEKAITTVLQ